MTIEHKWLTYDEINKVDVNSSQKDSEDSSILEIYLYYPKNLNDLHNECLLLPEKIQSKTCYQILAKNIIIIKQCNISDAIFQCNNMIILKSLYQT